MTDGIRISSLNSLADCMGFHVLQTQGPDSSGKAADTGTAVGRLIELFHRALDVVDAESPTDRQAASLVAVQQATLEQVTEFPLADLPGAIRTAGRYFEDPRAWSPHSEYGVVVPDLCEAEVRLTLAPDPDDPTQQPINLVGHVDIVRRVCGYLEVWDVKNTKRYQGSDATYKYAWQQACYVLAAAETWGEHVYPGGLVLTQAYHGKLKSKRPAGECGGVWLGAPWSLEQCRSMMRQVAYQIGRIRAGLIACTPSATCSYCPGEGVHNCERALDELLGGAE